MAPGEDGAALHVQSIAWYMIEIARYDIYLGTHPMFPIGLVTGE